MILPPQAVMRKPTKGSWAYNFKEKGEGIVNPVL